MATAKSWVNSSERELEKELRRKIKRLGPNLTVIDGGKQRMVEFGGESKPGWIDITAEDSSGATVVVELKIGRAGRRAVGQILGYMGALMRRRVNVRGILVADEFSPQGQAAARAVPNLELRKISSVI